MKQVKYLLTTHDINKLPKDDLPEVVFVGRSNVGKSSLINALTNQKIAYVGKRPGKTRAISLFEVDQRYRIVDIPGYGFAKASNSQRELFAEIISNYLEKRENLKHIIILIDSRRGLTDLDKDMISYTLSLNIGFSIVGTKLDKLNQSQRYKFTKNIKENLGTSPIIVSSLNKKNIDLLVEQLESTI
jgi:GTP-binding protein